MKIMPALAIVLVVAACAPAATPGWTYSPIATGSPAPAGSEGASPGPGGSPAGSPAPTPAPTSSPVSGVGDSVPFVVKDFTLDPADLTIFGTTVSLAVSNEGPTVHNITIRDESGAVLAATKDLQAGQTETLTVDLPAGTYTTFCSLPGHEILGIVGTLVVSP